MKKLIIIGLVLFISSCHTHKHCTTSESSEKVCCNKSETKKTCEKSETKPCCTKK